MIPRDARGVNPQFDTDTPHIPPPDDNASNGEWAEYYVKAFDWSVFPCHNPIQRDGLNCSCELYRRKKIPDFECSNPGKHPRTKNGLDDATTDLDQIREWWRRYPSANIGINCGKSRILVVDQDTYKDIYDGDDLELDEETVTALTGGGGTHLFYRMEDTDTFGNRNKNLPAGIDIRGHGGYVIVAPSGHESGNVYQWELEYAPWDIELALTPSKLRALLEQGNQKRDRAATSGDTSRKYSDNETGTRYGMRALENQVGKVRAAIDGTRNETLNSAAFGIAQLVGGGEIDENYAYDALLDAAAGCGLSDAEATATLDSAFGAGVGQPYSKSKKAATVASDEAVEAIATMLELAIASNLPLDSCKPLIKQLSDDQRRNPAIIDALVKVMPQESHRQKWLDSCGHVGETRADGWINALRDLGYTFALNQLEDMAEVDGKRLDDITRSKIYLEMDRHSTPKTYVDDAINVLCAENRYHPIRQYLTGLEWDGDDHLTAFLKCFDVERKTVVMNGKPTPLGWQIITRWLLGCVARGLHGDSEKPFKHQTPMMVLIGEQGMGKSTLFKWLTHGVGSDEYFQEGTLDPHKTEDKRSMVTKWIFEVAELGSSLRKSDRDALKGFITTELHTYRKPWGRANITKPTLANLVGTINPENGFLDDPTGHRRFLPVRLEGINHQYAELDVNQLWAQLVHMYQSGASPELSQAEKEALKTVYEENEVENPIQTYIQMYFDVSADDDSLKCHTATIIKRLRAFGVSLNSDERVAGRQINDALAPMGLKQSMGKISIDGVRGRGWLGIAPNGQREPGTL